MNKVSIRFLETKVVDDQFAGTARETRFEAGEVYELDARSADRWVKRGAARYLSDEDARRALGTSGDVALQGLDAKRDDLQGAGRAGTEAGGNPGQVVGSASGSPTGIEAERIAVTDRIAVLVVSQFRGVGPDAFAALGAQEQLDGLKALESEMLGSAGRYGQAGDSRIGTAPAQRRFGDEDLRGLAGAGQGDLLGASREPPVPGTSANAALEAAADTALPDTDGDRLGDAAPATGPINETPAGANFDAMTDDELRNHLEDRDGRRPGARTSRETLLARAKEPVEAPTPDPAAEVGADAGAGVAAGETAGASSSAGTASE